MLAHADSDDPDRLLIAAQLNAAWWAADDILWAGRCWPGWPTGIPAAGLMVVCDLTRAALVAAMAVGGMPIWALCVLLVAVQLAGAPFKAGRRDEIAGTYLADRRARTAGTPTCSYAPTRTIPGQPN